MKTIVCPFIFAMILALTAGCGKNCSVSGRVTYPDGTPLTFGEVAFETETFYAKGPIDSNGYFKMGSSNPGDGVPKGTYKVYIQNVMIPQEIFSAGPNRPPKLIFPKELPIDKKFMNAATSGLTCEVKGRMKYDITVESPAK